MSRTAPYNVPRHLLPDGIKKGFILSLLFLLCFRSSGQEKQSFSTELDANYHYYFAGSVDLHFNYGFSWLFSVHHNRVKVSTGIDYAIMSYDTQGDPFYSIQKREYRLKYLNFPVFVSVDILMHKKFSLSILTGLLFDHILDYTVRSYYSNGTILTEDDLLKERKPGMSWILGPVFSIPAGDKFIFSLTPFFRYPLISNHYEQEPGYTSIPDPAIVVGCKIGMEFLFCKQNPDHSP